MKTTDASKKKIIYYSDPLNDEFSGACIDKRTIDGSYRYIHKNPLWNFACYICTNILSIPIKYLYLKLKLHGKYVGRENLKPYRHKPYFVYANHTQTFADTFITSLPMYPKMHHFIVNPENVSIKGIEHIVEMLGALPIPEDIAGMKNFVDAVEKRISQNRAVIIYPEAHIWPFYTGIRPFKDVSFKYPSKLNVPVFTMTNTYQTYKNGKKFRLVTYIDGPFFPDMTLPLKERQKALRDVVFDNMSTNSRNSNYDHIIYKEKK